jgi:hypothetical protein
VIGRKFVSGIPGKWIITDLDGISGLFKDTVMKILRIVGSAEEIK